MNCQMIMVTAALFSLGLSSCVASNTQNNTSLSAEQVVLKTALFAKDAQVQEVVTEDCTLENGNTSQCAKFVLKYVPETLEKNTFCPETLNDTGGLWQWDGENAGLYRLDRNFFTMLDSIGYTFYDENESLYIADISVAEPTVDHSCIQVSYDEAIEVTVRLPLAPQMAEKETTLGVVSKVGLALDGAPIFSDAPSVQQTGHMPALTRCGGHVDPGGWFHWHATATDINTTLANEGVASDCSIDQINSGLFGYAFDGFPMYGSADQNGRVPDDLDSCNGHTGATPEYPEGQYHYHATTTFPNLPKCLKGVLASENFTTTAQAGVGGTGGGNNPPRPGGENGGPPPGGGPPNGGPPPQS